MLKLFQTAKMNHRYGKYSNSGEGSCKDNKIITQIRLWVSTVVRIRMNSNHVSYVKEGEVS
jgi:hypothetical protein